MDGLTIANQCKFISAKFSHFTVCIRKSSKLVFLRFAHPYICRPYTAAGGQPHTVWFDWPGIAPTHPEYVDTIDHMAERVAHLIDQTVEDAGIPINRILLGQMFVGVLTL